LSVIISCGFIALFFGLLTILGKYGYNFNLYPTGLKGTLNLIFIVVSKLNQLDSGIWRSIFPAVLPLDL